MQKQRNKLHGKIQKSFAHKQSRDRTNYSHLEHFSDAMKPSQSTFPAQEDNNPFQSEEEANKANIEEIYEEQSCQQKQYQIQQEKLQISTEKQQNEEYREKDQNEDSLWNFINQMLPMDMDNQSITKEYAQYYIYLMLNRLKNLKDKIQSINTKVQPSVTSISAKPRQGLLKNAKNRRPAHQINRKYQCLIPSCSKMYGFRSAVKVHMMLKHNICKQSIIFDRQDQIGVQKQLNEGHLNCSCLSKLPQMKQQLVRRSQIRLETSLANLPF